MKKIYLLWGKKEELSNGKKYVMDVLNLENLTYQKKSTEVIVENKIEIIYKKMTKRTVKYLLENSSHEYLFISNLIENLNLFTELTGEDFILDGSFCSMFNSLNLLPKRLMNNLIKEFPSKEFFIITAENKAFDIKKIKNEKISSFFGRFHIVCFNEAGAKNKVIKIFNDELKKVKTEIYKKNQEKKYFEKEINKYK